MAPGREGIAIPSPRPDYILQCILLMTKELEINFITTV